MLDGVRWLNLDMSGPTPLRLRAAQMAAERGIPVLINDVYQTDHPLLPYVDVLVLSAAVIRGKYAGTDPLALALALLDASDCDIVLTDAGDDITLLLRDGQRMTIGPPAVEAVDTTGAGDIFKSGLLYGLLRELPLPEAAKWGAAAGSLICQYAGTTQTLAPLSAVEALIDSISPS